MSAPTLGQLVQRAYDKQIEYALRARPLFRSEPPTDEDRARWARLQQEEDDRKVSIMKAHQTLPDTTSMCRCGHVGYSTPGYLLHLYEVVAADVSPDY